MSIGTDRIAPTAILGKWLTIASFEKPTTGNGSEGLIAGCLLIDRFRIHAFGDGSAQRQ